MPADEGMQVEENALTMPSSSEQSLVPPTPTPQPGESTPTLPGDTGTEAVDPPAPAAEAASVQEPAAANTQDSKSSVFQRRIDALTAEKHEARRLAKAAQDQTDVLLQQLADMRAATSGSPPAPAPTVVTPETPPAVKPIVALSEAEIEARVEKRADEKARIAAFDKACNDIAAAGKSEFNDFDDALKNFSMLGGIPAPMLETLTEMPNAHKVLRAIGKDPELAERVIKMSPMKMAMELARIESGLDKPAAPKPLSTAPKPITPIDSAARAEEDPDKMSTPQWIQWREKNKKSRW